MTDPATDPSGAARTTAPGGRGADGPGRRLVALVAAPATAARAVPLLAALGAHADVVSWHRRGDRRPDALVVTSVGALEDLAAAGEMEDRPAVVWVRDEAGAQRARSLGAVLLLSAHPDLHGDDVVLVPPVGVEVDRWPWAAPVVRRRRRERLGLPGDQVVRIPDDEDPAATAGLDGPTTSPLATCAAAVVHGPATLVALALGAPTVTSAETARRLGLRAGRDVEVAAGPSAAVALAEAIAADDQRAASLSRRGRRCAEHHLDVGRPARAIARALGLAPDPDPMRALVADRLGELGCAADGEQARRVAVALAGLGVDGGGSVP